MRADDSRFMAHTDNRPRTGFAPVDAAVQFPVLEKEVLAFWAKHRTFYRSLEGRQGAPRFRFYDGPPFATGLPHFGHFLPSVIKDIVGRYWTMRGYHVERRFGWDCHGLPVENEMERELGISGKAAIEEYGVAQFNEACRSIVLRYTEEWRAIITRLGRWVDFENEYRTMDADYTESIWWVWKELWDRRLLDEGHSVQPYCPRCATPLSNFEVNQGYQDVQDPSVTIRLPLVGEGSGSTYLMVWTTTPWTLPSNMGLAVGEAIDYALVEVGNERYWVAQARLEHYFGADDGAEILAVEPGTKLVGRRYQPPFDTFRQHADRAFQVVAAEFVTTDEGTGIVHVAPAFGEDDYAVGQRHGWPLVMPIDQECRFTSEVPEHQGEFVKDADAALVRRLREAGRLVEHATLQHSYPHCYRCDSPLIYRAIDAWFLNVEPIKARLLENNAQINWVPAHMRDGRFGKWLANARDWNLSRNRYWGAPIPVWKAEDGSATVAIGSRAELEERSGVAVTDLHKHFVDAVSWTDDEGRVFKRVPQVLDCWFESGAMPYAQVHHPFAGDGALDRHFPADFIAEGIDQTRGWFYTLLVLSTALFDEPAYKNVIVNGMVLAEDGRKMSKRLKNYPDPVEVLEKFGADALRAYLISSPGVRAGDVRLSEDAIRDVMRQVLLPLWNAQSFFLTYAAVDGWTPQGPPVEVTARLDRWILSDLQTVIDTVNQEMERYRLDRVVPVLDAFIDDLTNWYIRLSRARFWKAEDDADKRAAYQTLYEVLVTFSKVLAPVLPFVCESMYQNLTAKAGFEEAESVHLADFPVADQSRRDLELEREVQMARIIVTLGRSLRARQKIRTRQPLPEVTVVARSSHDRQLIADMEALILDELNVKRLVLTDREEDLVHVTAKANFRELGKRYGKAMRRAAEVIAGFDLSTIRRLESGTAIEVCGEQVTQADIIVERRERDGHLTDTADGLTVSLSTVLTPELVAEGYAREVKNRVQQMRKEADLNVVERIDVTIGAAPDLVEQLSPFADYIQGECLAARLSFAGPGGASPEVERQWEVAGQPVWIGIKRLPGGRA